MTKVRCRGFEKVKNAPRGTILPTRKTRASAGYDFYLPCDVSIDPYSFSKIIPTGIKAYMPEDEVLMLHIRSSIGILKHVVLANCTGIIDSDYFYSDNEGHIFIKLTNASNEGKTVELAAGSGFAQGIFLEYGITVDDEADGVRNGGFGSTTNKA